MRSLLRHVDHDTGCDELPHGNLSRRAATFGEMDGRIEMRPTVLWRTKRISRIEVAVLTRPVIELLQNEIRGRGGPVEGLVIVGVGEIDERRGAQIETWWWFRGPRHSRPRRGKNRKLLHVGLRSIRSRTFPNFSAFFELNPRASQETGNPQAAAREALGPTPVALVDLRRAWGASGRRERRHGQAQLLGSASRATRYS